VLGILRKRKTDENSYHPTFWLLFWGVFFNRITASMLWPFLTIYMYQKLGVALTTITFLLSLRAVFGVVATAIVSPMMDKLGRKGLMLFGLVTSALVFFAMTFATNMPQWAVVVAVHGMVMPIFNIGVNTMVADIVPQERRSPAYALMRTVGNAGIAIGPVIGGMLAVRSFELMFISTGIAYLLLMVLIYLFIPETMPKTEKVKNDEAQPKGIRALFDGVYGDIIRDGHFMTFLMAYFVVLMSYTHMFSLLPIYVSENFGMAENQYSLILSVNAVIVVLFQYVVTKYTDHFSPYSIIMGGAMLYVIGFLTVSFGSVLWHFMMSMVIITIGELMIMPTATTLVANLAPENMRARYLGLLALGYPIGSGLGPVVGGILNDSVAPVAIWYGAATLAVIGVIGFFLLSQTSRDKQPGVA
jgi:MFS family permease